MPTLGQELYDAGWRQGCVIPGGPPQVHCSDLTGQMRMEPLPEGMFLALATQDCDLVKSNDRLPLIEAIGCMNDSELARTVRPNDTRYFVLNRTTGTVADRAFGTFLKRDALVELPPPDPPCGGDSRAARRFAVWLGARYDRPALPTRAVEQLQRPLTKALRRLCGRGKRHERLNRDLHEIRVVADLSSGPPYDIELLIFLLTEDAAIEASEFAVAEVIEEAGFSVRGFSDAEGEEAAATIQNWIVVRPSQLSVAHYQAATPIPLMYESIDGDEQIGAPPLDAESA